MTSTDLDLADYRTLMDTRGHNPNEFQVLASPIDPSEGELGPSRRTVTAHHSKTGIAREYALRTWLTDFEADLLDGAFDKK